MPAMALSQVAKFIGWCGFVAIGLAVALGFVMWRADTFSDRANDYAQKLANEKAAHAVTTASLNQLQARLATFVADGERRAKSAAEALEKQRARSAALDKQIARLRAERPTEAEMERCETPASVMEAAGL